MMNKIRMSEPDSGMFLIRAYKKIHYPGESLSDSLNFVFEHISLHNHQVTNLYKEHFIETSKLTWREKGILLSLINGTDLLQQYNDFNKNLPLEIEESIDSLVELELLKFNSDSGILQFELDNWSSLTNKKVRALFIGMYNKFIFDIFSYAELSLEAKAIFFYIKTKEYFQIDRASIHEISKDKSIFVEKFINELICMNIIKANSKVIYSLELIQTKEQMELFKSKLLKNLDHFLQIQSTLLFSNNFVHQFRAYFSNLSVYQVASITDNLAIIELYDLESTEQCYEFLHPLVLAYQFESYHALSYLFSTTTIEQQIQLLVRMIIDNAAEKEFEKLIALCTVPKLRLLRSEIYKISLHYDDLEPVRILLNLIIKYIKN